MGKVLYIVANPKGLDESYSQRVGRAFLKSYQWYRPSDEIVMLDLYNMDIPYIDQKVFGAWDKLVKNHLLTEEEMDLVDYIDDMIEQFVAAERYIIVSPMWNSLFPAKLKAYLDIVCFAGRKYQNHENGMINILNGKKTLFIQARGGEYKTPEMRVLDFATPFMKTIFHSLGLTDFRAIHVEGMLMKPHMAKAIERAAIYQAREYAAWFAGNRVSQT